MYSIAKVKEAIPIILNAMRLQQYAGGTVENHQGVLNAFVKYLQDNHIKEIDETYCVGLAFLLNYL